MFLVIQKNDNEYDASCNHLLIIALEECTDINMYLRPIRHQFEDYEQADFGECEPYLAPMMHTVCLIWTHSQYYNNPARIIVLLQEICNMIIDQVKDN
jgi:dynein heavy chain